MSREYTNKLWENLEEDLLSYETILKGMLCFFSESDIRDFCLNSFGNEGVFTEQEIKEIENKIKEIENN